MITFAKAAMTALIWISCAVAAGETMIELERYINGRDSANFLKSAANVKLTLSPGTRGKVLETKKFGSGNFGLKVHVVNGSHRGETVWIYYRSADPGMILYEAKDDLAREREVKDVTKATGVATTRSLQAIRDRAPAATGAASENHAVVRSLRAVTDAVGSVGSTKGLCAQCDTAEIYLRDTDAMNQAAPAQRSAPSQRPAQREHSAQAASITPGAITPPRRSRNPSGLSDTICQSHIVDVGSCWFKDTREYAFFQISNQGPNRIVGGTRDGRYREWRFHFEGYATQDLGISITDAPSGVVSQTQESFLMLFPRRSLPSARVVGNKIITTLPTGETMTFDRQTKQVIAGAFTEDRPLSAGAPAKVSYRGSGVMVRVNATGTNPRTAAKNATITRSGRTCTVPAQQLWPDRSERSNAHFKYATDAEFDRYLRSTCGFGIY